MPSQNFPGPNYNKLIEQDSQIVKIDLDIMEWGARMSVFPKGANPDSPGKTAGAPKAPEFSIKHVSGS
jgi:hypothetical protein